MNSTLIVVLVIGALITAYVRERSLRRNEQAKKVLNDKVKDIESAVAASAAANAEYERLRSEYSQDEQS